MFKTTRKQNKVLATKMVTNRCGHCNAKVRDNLKNMHRRVQHNAYGLVFCSKSCASTYHHQVRLAWNAINGYLEP